MYKRILKTIDGCLVVLAILTCLLVAYLFTSILDFFPWGDTKSYFIWGLLIFYFIVPLFLIVGIIRVLIHIKSRNAIHKISFFVVGFLLYLPLEIGFDSNYDLWGRWVGVWAALASILLLCFELKFILRSFEFKTPKRNSI